MSETNAANQLAVRPPSEMSNKISDMGRLANAFAQSAMFPDCKDASQAMVKIWAGDEMGLSAFESMTGIYIVKGRMTMSANLMAAKIKRSGKYNYTVKQHTSEVCDIEFREYDANTKQWSPVGVSRFTAKDANAAGLGGDNWRKFPRNMLFARAMSNGAKWYCPDVFGGPVYTPDELGAAVDGETGQVLAPRARESAVVEGEIVDDLDGITAADPPSESKATVSSSLQPRKAA